MDREWITQYVDILYDGYLECAEIDALLEPNRVEIQAERSTIRVVVTLEVVHQHLKHFFFRAVRRARIYHGTRVLLTELRFVSLAYNTNNAAMPYFDFQLIEDHLPDAWEASARAALPGADARVRHFIIKRVRPDGRVAQRCCHARIVNKAEFFHHQELTVPADTQERYADSANVFHVNVGEAVNDVRLADHLIKPVFDCSVSRPPVFRLSMPLRQKKKRH